MHVKYYIITTESTYAIWKILTVVRIIILINKPYGYLILKVISQP